MPQCAPYDLIAIGTGSAAKKVATACRRAGWRVAVVDHRPFGGTCALRGCDPKKALWSVAHAYDVARRLGTAGLRGTEGLSLDWSEMAAFKRGFTAPVPAKREALFQEEGIDAFHGLARFAGPNAIAIGEGPPIEARHVLIAAGAEPVPLPMPGAEHLITSDEFLELDAPPESLLLVGGGYIAFEFAHTAARVGVGSITILEREGRCLNQFDRDMVHRLEDKSRRLGIELHTDAKVVAMERRNDGRLTVHARISGGAGGQSRRFEVAMAVHAAGRMPALRALDLPAGGVELEDGGRRLRLNRYLQSTSNPAVFAAGDAADRGPALTPVASHDAEIVAANLLEGLHHEPDYTGVPSVAFTIPTITAVGLTEEAAHQQGLRFRVNHRDMTAWQAVRHVQEDTAAYKVLIEEGTERILGAHLLGPDAENTINLFALAMRLGLSARDMTRFVSAFPTAASNVFHMLE